MNASTGTRELFELECMGNILQGTCHRTRDESSAHDVNPNSSKCIGMVFLSGMGATRSANGDAAVYWGDALAKNGHLFFRLDLPGYGDSSGDPPPEWIRRITAGGDAPVASAAIRELAAQFHLSGVIVVGHCSGTISAILSAATNDACKGLVLMDPYFHLPLQKPSRVRRTLHLWAARLGIDQSLANLYEYWKGMHRTLRGSGLPDNANIPLIKAWKTVVSAGIPVLILKSPGRNLDRAKAKSGEFDYAQYIQKLTDEAGDAGFTTRVMTKTVDGSHHSFANQVGRTAVLQHMEHWLTGNFPVEQVPNPNMETENAEPDRLKHLAKLEAV